MAELGKNKLREGFQGFFVYSGAELLARVSFLSDGCRVTDRVVGD